MDMFVESRPTSAINYVYWYEKLWS